MSEETRGVKNKTGIQLTKWFSLLLLLARRISSVRPHYRLAVALVIIAEDQKPH